MRSILAIVILIAALLAIGPLIETGLHMVRLGADPFLATGLIAGMIGLVLVLAAEGVLWLTGYYDSSK